MIPPNSPAEVAKKMNIEIEEQLDDILWKIKRRWRSDLNELLADFKKEEEIDNDDREAIQALEAEFA